MNEVIKFYNFEDAIEYSKKFKTDPKNLGQKLSIEILEEYQSVKGHDFTQIDNLIINFYKYPLKTIELENVIFKILLININISNYNKIKFKNCLTINNGKITIAPFDGSFADSVLSIEVGDSSLSIISYFSVKFNATDPFTKLWCCRFEKDIEIFLSKKSEGISFNNCDFLGSIEANGEFGNLRGLNFEECEMTNSNTCMNVKNINLYILKSNFKYINFDSENKFPFLIDIDSSEIDLLLIRTNQKLTIKSQLKLTKINLLEMESGVKALELSNCIIEKAIINGEITDRAIFNNVTFKNAPEIGDIKFKNCNVEFSDVKFLDTHSPQAIAGFRALNKACRDANYHHGEIFFHGLTLEGIGKNLKYKSDFVEKSFSFFYKYFSDFGRSINRPLCWLVGIFFFFIVINFVGIAINKINDLKLSQQSLINKLTVDNNQILTKINDIKDIPTKNMEICEEKSRLINYLNSQQQLVSNKSIVENNKNCDEQFQLIKIYSKIIFKNAIGPLQLALPKDFISDCESKFYNQNSNSIIYFLNFFHAVISSAIWFIWLFMIRARFKL